MYLTFVDYSSLTGYYGNWTSRLSKETESADIIYFCEAITQLKSFLLCKPVKDRFENPIKPHNLHPILLGRILAVKILANNYETIELLLNPYFQASNKRNASQLELSYELMIIAISTCNIELMSYIINQISKHMNPIFQYQKYYINIYYLMCMFYYKLINKKEEKKKYTKLYNPEELRSSYLEFINILDLIFNYSETKSMSLKSDYKEHYLSLSKKLNYPYFSENLLTKYFNASRIPGNSN